MLSSTRFPSRNSCACCAFIVLACASQIALTAIAIGLATNDVSLNGSIFHIAWAASTSDILAVAALFGVIILYLCPGSRSIRAGLCVSFVIVALLALTLTIYTLVWIWNSTQHAHTLDESHVSTRRLAQAGFATWSFAVVAQAVLYTILLWQPDNHVAHLPAEELAERPSPARSAKRSLSMHLAALSPPSPPPFLRSSSEPASPTFSTKSFDAKSSLRYSVNQVIRPMTSKTKLLLRHPSLSRDSYSLYAGRETSMDAIMPDDGFESWDTSRVEHIDESDFLRKTSRIRLETIPGSRPVSPAKPLDGPFPEDSHESVHLPESPRHSPFGSPSSETSSLRFSSPQAQRDSGIDQSHIHPLFRSESPVPPPIASPGTVITASPYAGQVVSSEHQTFAPRRLHSAQSFRAESPSPLSPPRSQQGSFRSFQAQQSSPVEHFHAPSLHHSASHDM